MQIDFHTHRVENEHNTKSIRNLSIDYAFLSNIEDVVLEEGQMYSVGIHPWHIDLNHLHEQLYCLEKIANHPQVKLIGEAGLDKICETEFKIQEKVFLDQIRIAERVGKPMVVHCVRSYNELMAIKKLLKPKIPMIVHGFNKNAVLAKALIQDGFYLSFGKAMINNPSLTQLLHEIPLENVFFETDDASEISLGKIYHTAALELKIPMAELEETIYENYLSIIK